MKSAKKVVFRIDTIHTEMAGNNGLSNTINREFTLNNYETQLDEAYVLFAAWFGLVQSMGVSPFQIVEVVDACISDLMEQYESELEGEDYDEDEDENTDTTGRKKEKGVSDPLGIVERERKRRNLLNDEDNFNKFSKQLREAKDEGFIKKVYEMYIDAMLEE